MPAPLATGLLLGRVPYLERSIYVLLGARAIRVWGVSGIKLHPTVGYFPHDRACYPIYELCVAHGLPVLFHTGPISHPRLYSRFTHPWEFDQPATDFPRLTIIMGHAGGDWWAEAITIARGHPNMFLELSGWQLELDGDPEKACHVLTEMRNVLGVERLVWGTDFPSMRRFMSLRESMEVFRRLPSTGREYGFEFDEGDVDAILGGNAETILGLK